MDNYLPILVLLILGLLFASVSFVASRMLGPRQRPTSAKVAPYECGIVPTIEPPTTFPVRFYLIAMIFIIFDIEIVFLYPWAVIFRQLRSFGLTEVVVFAAVVLVAFLFLISNGALTWGPAKRLVSAMPSRTSDSTITRIGTGPGGPGGTTPPGGTREKTSHQPDDVPRTGEPGNVPVGPGRAA
ncbi:MAG: NADH-quinone oxidoreductase subunit A [Acidimicrobiales bacterium]